LKQVSKINTTRNENLFCDLFSTDVKNKINFMIDTGAQASLIKIDELPKGHNFWND